MNNEKKKQNVSVLPPALEQCCECCVCMIAKKSIEIYVLCLLGLCFDCGEEYKVLLLFFCVLYRVIIFVINMIQTHREIYIFFHVKEI